MICAVYKMSAVGVRPYIGASIDCDTRWSMHRSELRHKTHSYPEFLPAFESGKIKFTILEECEPVFLKRYWNKRLKHWVKGRWRVPDYIEQKWMDKYPNRVNRSRFVTPKGVSHVFSTEHCEKISKALTGIKRSLATCERIRQAKLGTKHSMEAREKVSRANKGKILSTETKEKIRQARLRYWATRK